VKEAKIVYSTRTHTQISQVCSWLKVAAPGSQEVCDLVYAQVVDELRSTTYTPWIAILAAKKHYCINDDVRKSAFKRGTDIDKACDDCCNSKDGCEFKKTAIRMTEAGEPHLKRCIPRVPLKPVSFAW
jgi:hypothetical protein